MLRARIEHNRWIGHVTHRRVRVPYGLFALSHQQKQLPIINILYILRPYGVSTKREKSFRGRANVSTPICVTYIFHKPNENERVKNIIQYNTYILYIMGRSGWQARHERVKIILYFMKSETSAAHGGRFKLVVNIIQHIYLCRRVQTFVLTYKYAYIPVYRIQLRAKRFLHTFIIRTIQKMTYILYIYIYYYYYYCNVTIINGESGRYLQAVQCVQIILNIRNVPRQTPL